MNRDHSDKDVFNISKEKNLSEWYLELVRRAKLVDQRTPVKGFDVFMPDSYEVWEKIQEHFNKEIKKTGHRNAYFPLVIPESLLQEEAEHFEGFVPEVAWVTHGGDERLDNRLAIRPTSETIMYYMYALWVRSYNDLPLLYNQWCNIVRWETKMTKPFLRGREFLWQEGHTAHATHEEALAEVRYILGAYKELVENLLALPVMFIKRPHWDKFAGAVSTISLESIMPDGKVLQAGTAHDLGQNFSKPFKIQFLDEHNEKKFVWQTSWGFSTRLIGGMVMEHGDDKGLVMPPNVAPVNVAIIPILFKGKEKPVIEKCRRIKKELEDAGFVVKIDERDLRPGEKHYFWEMKGIPIRLEIGPRDVENNRVVLVRRDTGDKINVDDAELLERIQKTNETIQNNLFSKAKKFFKAHQTSAKTKSEIKKIAENGGGLIKIPFCSVEKEGESCADALKEYAEGVEVRGTKYPNAEKAADGMKCPICGKKATVMVYVARSY